MNWNRITIHHTATPSGRSVESIRRYHMEERGWSDIGYHWLVGWIGDVEMGRPMYRTGSHAYRNNTDNIGIALVGTFTDEPPPEEQLFAAAELCAGLCASLGIRTAAILPHYELKETICPGVVNMAKLRRMVSQLRTGRYPRASDLD